MIRGNTGAPQGPMGSHDVHAGVTLEKKKGPVFGEKL